MKTIIIMGGNDVSLNIGKILKKKKFRVIFIFRKKKKIFSSFENKIISVSNYKKYKEFFNHIRPDYLINMYSAHTNNINITYRVNIKLSLFLINFFSDKKTKLILIGSAAEYGVRSDKKKISETDNLRPNNYYGISKLIQSTILLKYAKIICSKTIVLRIFNMYGKIYAKHLLIGKINNIIKKGKNSFNLGSLKDFRDYISTEKASQMIIKCMLKGNYYSVYNIGSGNLMKVREVVKKYFKIIKLKKYKIIEKKSYNDSNYSCANIRKYKSIL
tara:strand:+ start:1477 stop:2295 length:819 start_codon:yes stop_codon:yes gene_type:complete